jgi:hypothetical protein
MNGFFMPLRGVASGQSEEPAYKWDGTESASRSLSASASGPGRRVLASIEGHYLERLSAASQRRALATLLGPARRIAQLTAKAGGLAGYVLLRGRGPICYCVIDGHWGAAVLAENGSSIATVTREIGGSGHIQCFGTASALRLLQHYQDEWLQRGSPVPGDLCLTVSFGSPAPRRSWRRLVLGTSVVTMNWRRS